MVTLLIESMNKSPAKRSNFIVVKVVHGGDRSPQYEIFKVAFASFKMSFNSNSTQVLNFQFKWLVDLSSSNNIFSFFKKLFHSNLITFYKKINQYCNQIVRWILLLCDLFYNHYMTIITLQLIVILFKLTAKQKT